MSETDWVHSNREGGEDGASAWRPIETAPRDGTVIEVRRVYKGDLIYQGPAAWVHFSFPALPPHPLTGDIYAPAYEDDGWGYPPGHRAHGKRVPGPDEWRSAPTRHAQTEEKG